MWLWAAQGRLIAYPLPLLIPCTFDSIRHGILRRPGNPNKAIGLSACIGMSFPTLARLYADLNQIAVMIFIFRFEAVCIKLNMVNSN